MSRCREYDRCIFPPPLPMTIKIPVTMTANIFLDEDALNLELANCDTRKYHDVIERMAMAVCPDEGDSFKVTSIEVHSDLLK